MRSDANKIALRAVRRILEAARPGDVTVGGKRIDLTVAHGPEDAWPTSGPSGIDEREDGPWPTPVRVECKWEGGKCTLDVRCTYARGGRHRGQIAARVRLMEPRRMLVWINVAGGAIADAEDGRSVKMRGAASTFKRQADLEPDLGRRLGAAIRDVVRESGLPLASRASVEIAAIDVPSGDVKPSPESAFQRLVHLALVKLDFLERGPQAGVRGKPLVDLSRWGLDLAKLRSSGEEGSDEEEDEVDSGEQPTREFWAGGFAERARLEQFVAGRFWQVGWKRSDKPKAAQRTWARFDEIEPGDWFAIKGYGGANDLVIHFVGEVTSIDPEAGRLELRPLDIPRYKGKAPTGGGGGNWHDTLVPVKRLDAILQIFGVGTNAARIAQFGDVPKNLILYGPPGTGKTYAIQSEYHERFVTAAPETRETVIANVASELSWYQAIAVALEDLGGAAKVDALIGHPLLRAKHASASIPTPLRQMTWGTLGQHTVERSTTVKMKRRFGELLFDKRADGTWILAEPLPDDLTDALARLKRPAADGHGASNYSFVTFHQAYGYEDFIEGIRPKILSAGEESGELAYELQDGVFMRAVRAALRISGYDGNLDSFCALSRDERARILSAAPRYAVFIDEINRGNVARIFGELITLLEDDKRLGEENELIVTLPYSRSRFGVPSNLHVIGTMNTADRSVEALDAALRRRFEFRELAPKPELLNFEIEEIHIGKLLSTINRRLERLRDRDHAIGHAYFLPLEKDDTLEALKHIFRAKIMPLLHEYFFDDIGKIGLVLGRDFVRRRDPDSIELADCDHDERDALSDKPMWEIVDVDQLTDDSFRRIYERVDAG